MTKPPFIKFRIERNRAFDLGGQTYRPRFELRPIPNTPFGEQRQLNGLESGNVPVQPFFFVGVDAEEQDIQLVELLDETPRVSVKPEGMSDAHYAALANASIAVAIKNKEINDEIRRRIAVYENSGTIKVVEDPFAVKLEPLSDSIAK
jgi:hypothetical protein